MLEELQTEICDILNSVHEASIDELSTDNNSNDFDFTNIGCFFTLNIANGLGNRNTFTLQVYLISQKNNKLSMQSIAENIDNKINNKVLDCNAIVRHPGVWFNSFIDDEELQNILLTYSVDKF